jgi:hypothetical protein
VLADLEERRVRRGFDEIAFRIDIEKARPLAPDLPAHDEGRPESVGALADRRGIVDDFLDDRADQLRGLEHGAGFHERGPAGAWRANAFVDQAGHGLSRRQVAGREQHDCALAGRAPGPHLGKGRDVVQARIGPGIGHEDQPAVHLQPDTICHRPVSPTAPVRR